MGVPVSIGICAYNEKDRIRSLFDSLRRQELPPPLELREILVVTSGCTDGTEDEVAAYGEQDPRIRLIRQPARLGKASALNEILRSYQGDFLVLVNADARLAPGSVGLLLRPFLASPDAAVACGAPVPVTDGGRLPGFVEELEWGVHNRSLEALSRRGTANHCCDELMAIRRGFVECLPADLINDGAYVGVYAALRGHTVCFCSGAKVYVQGPRNLRGIVQQRRRVLLGHAQVRDLLHRRPSTLKEIAKRDPRLAASILAAEIRQRPSYLGFLLLVALPLELLSSALAFADRAWRSGYSPVWAKVDEL